ncbi:MAG: sigma-70 family RNA polymerase sigma factor, partial [Sphingobacteriales bacterium]
TMLLLGVGMKYLKDRDAAEDAVQQVFLKALTHMPDGEIRNFKGWLYILIRNHCLQQLRDRTWQAGEEALQSVPAAEDNREALKEREYTLEQMTDALAALTPEQRQAVEMFYLKKMSYQQIMDQTGHSFMQVKSFIQNGKRNLKLIILKKLGEKRQ